MKRKIKRAQPGKDFQAQLDALYKKARDEAFDDAKAEFLKIEASMKKTHDKQFRNAQVEADKKIAALIKKNRALQTKLTTAYWNDAKTMSLAAQAANEVLVDQLICLDIEIEMLVKLILHMKAHYTNDASQHSINIYNEVTNTWRTVHDINQPALKWADEIRKERIDAEKADKEKPGAELPTKTFAGRREADRAEAGQGRADHALRRTDPDPPF